MMPGTSRSAASIIGGMTQGLSRKAAAEFFFLAVPTMLAVTIYSIFVKHGEKGLHRQLKDTKCCLAHMITLSFSLLEMLSLSLQHLSLSNLL